VNEFAFLDDQVTVGHGHGERQHLPDQCEW
jgi:hypothetical protein